MFDDSFDMHDIMGLQASSDVYQAWEAQMEEQMAAANDNKKLVVLEIGCGVRVPSVRRECHDVLQDVALKCRAAAAASETKHNHQPCIRINPEDFQIDEPPAECRDWIETIAIQGSALAALKAIDEQLDLLK